MGCFTSTPEHSKKSVSHDRVLPQAASPPLAASRYEKLHPDRVPALGRVQLAADTATGKFPVPQMGPYLGALATAQRTLQVAAACNQLSSISLTDLDVLEDRLLPVCHTIPSHLKCSSSKLGPYCCAMAVGALKTPFHFQPDVWYSSATFT